MKFLCQAFNSNILKAAYDYMVIKQFWVEFKKEKRKKVKKIM